MKKIFLAFFIAIIGISSAIAAADPCWVHRKTNPGEAGMYHFNETYKCCLDAGVNCKIVRCEDNIKNGSIEHFNGGWQIKTQLEVVKLEVLVEGKWIEKEREGSNYVFTQDDYLVIDDCPTNPGLKGITISLIGIQTDENGNYSVFVPKL